MKQLLLDIWNRIKGRQQFYLCDHNYTDILSMQQYTDIIASTLIISKTDLNGNITFVNDEFCKIFNIKREDVIGKNHSVVKCKITSKEQFKDMWYTIKHGEVWKGMMTHNLDGKLLWFYTTIYPIFDKKERIKEYFSVRTDITEMIKLRSDVEKAQEEMIIRLGSMIEGKDPELRKHVYRVAEYSYILAKALRLPENECKNIKMASPIHDAGKVCVPDRILHKPGKLNKKEMEIMKSHARSGYELFMDTPLRVLQIAATIAHEHHEKWDGTGYPRGLKGKEISIYGRIVALADVYDALSMKRIYKDPWTQEEIEEFLMNQSGKHFDPKLVKLFFKHKDEFIKVCKELN